MERKELGDELDRLIVVLHILFLLNKENEEHVKTGGLFWQRDKLRARYSTVTGPLSGAEFTLLHILVIHVGIFIGLVSPTVLYPAREYSSDKHQLYVKQSYYFDNFIPL